MKTSREESEDGDEKRTDHLDFISPFGIQLFADISL